MIYKLFGYERVDKIRIPEWFVKPGKTKMRYKRWHYKFYGMFESPVLLDKENTLIDGYTSYLIAKENGLKYVKVKKVK